MSEEKKQLKTKEALKAIKEEVENLNKKLQELTDEELAQVTGGMRESITIHIGQAGIQVGN